MSTYVILLRAVNLAGHGKLSMAEFRGMLADLGFMKVETYIQSGNAVVDTRGSAAQVAQIVADGLEKLMGAPVAVVVRTHEQMEKVIRENPFAREAAAEGAKVHLAFLAETAAPAAIAGLERIAKQYPERRDRYHLAGDHIYFHLPDGAANTKFTGKAFDRAIGVVGTARNWNTVLKLHELSKR